MKNEKKKCTITLQNEWPIWKFKVGGKGRRVVGRRVEGNGYPSPCLDVFKISKGKMNNQPLLLFGCFQNQDGNERNDLKRQIYPYLKMFLQHCPNLAPPPKNLIN